MSLIDKKCVPCKGNVEPLALKEIEKLLANLNNWNISEGGKKITREFSFKNFASALDFVNQIGELAEAEGHHPDLTLGWGYCGVTLQTHSIGGLHENDFIVAAKIDNLAE